MTCCSRSRHRISPRRMFTSIRSSGRSSCIIHGLEAVGNQLTRVATSQNGIDFTTRPACLGRSYFRVFRHGDMTFALAMPGQLYRSADGFQEFEPGATLFNPNMRHAALLQRGDTLLVFWTQVGDAPERILLSRIDLSGDWREWRDSVPVEVLRPERTGKAPARRSCRRFAARRTDRSINCAIPLFSRKTDASISSTRSPAKVASRSRRYFSMRRPTRRADAMRAEIAHKRSSIALNIQRQGPLPDQRQDGASRSSRRRVLCRLIRR